jgi:hypothetical protein
MRAGCVSAAVPSASGFANLKQAMLVAQARALRGAPAQVLALFVFVIDQEKWTLVNDQP